MFSTDGNFLEAVLETYVGEKNTRNKGQRAAAVRILRGNELETLFR